jgi:hypothetical protein
LKNISNYNLRNIVHKYRNKLTYKSDDNNLNFNYDNLLNSLEHNILYIKNIFDNIYIKDINKRILSIISIFSYNNENI